MLTAYMYCIDCCAMLHYQVPTSKMTYHSVRQITVVLA